MEHLDGRIVSKGQDTIPKECGEGSKNMKYRGLRKIVEAGDLNCPAGVFVREERQKVLYFCIPAVRAARQ